MRVQLDRGHLAAELRRLAARRRAQVEHALAVLRADGEPDELRAAALRPDQPVGDGEVVDALDAVRAGKVGRLGAGRRVALDEADDRLERLVHRPHQRERVGGAEVAHPDVVDPVGIGLLQRAVGQAVEQRPDALGEPSHDRVRERHGALEARAADELDRLVRRGVRRRLRVRELVRAETERRAHRRVELVHRPLAQRLDRVVERAHALDRAVRETVRERALAFVEIGRGAAEDAVGVRLLLEHAQQHLVRDAAGRRDAHARRPRTYSSNDIRRPPSGCTSTSSSEPSAAARAFHTISGRPSTTARAPMCGDSARTRFTSSAHRTREIELAILGPDLLGVGDAVAGLRRERRLGLRQHLAEQLGRDLGGARVDGARVVVRPDVEGTLRGDRPGVELGDRPVDGDAGALVAGHERALDRRGAAPARQQRRVDVEPQRAVEQRVRDQQPVRADDDGVGAEVDRLVQRRRLRHGDAEPLARSPSRAAPPACGRGRAACPAASAGARRRAARRAARGRRRRRVRSPRRRSGGPRQLRTMRGRRTDSASRRASGVVRSRIRTPSRWSFSCCAARA